MTSHISLLPASFSLLPLLPFAALLAGVLLQLAFGRVLTNKGKGWLAFACGLAALLGGLAMIPTIAGGQTIDVILPGSVMNVAWQLHVDGLGLLFALMAAGIGSAILLYCVDYMAHEPSGATRFYILMLTFIAGLVGLVFSNNLLLAYMCWEVIGLCSYFLVGFWYQEPAAANGARKVLLMTHLPGYAFLLAILYLYNQSGTFLWTDPALVAQFNLGIFLLILVAAMAKSVMFPLHTWIPEAMNAPTPVSALLHSACYVKAGIYLIARMYSLNAASPWPASWQTLVLAIGCVTMLVGALFALAQADLKRLLAFSTISQLGYIVAGIGLGTPAGLLAGLFYTFSHGLFKGTLFLCAGAVQHSTGTRDMRRLGGLAARMPGTARIWLVAAAAIIGVPLTNGFVAKWLLFDAALQQGMWAVVVVAWLVSIITAFYILKATVSVFYGDLPAGLRDAHIEDASQPMQIGMGVLAFLCLLFGLAPQLLARWVVIPAAAAIGFPQPFILTWLGLHTTETGAPAVAGGAILLAALLLASLVFAVYAVSRMGRSAGTVNIFTGGDPIPSGGSAGAEDFAELAQTALDPVYTATNPDPIYLLLWRSIRWLAGLVNRSMAPLERRPLLASIILAGIIFVAVWLR